jgi:flagellar assembly protein FliH
LSEMVESYTLSPFNDDSGSLTAANGDHDFMNVFDSPIKEGDGPETSEEVIDVQAISRKAFEDAFVQGEKAGYEMGMKKVDPLVKRLGSYISHIEEFRKELVMKSEAMSVELALLFCEAIILRECEDKKEIIGEMARKALDICEEKNNIVIRVRQEDAQYISTDGHGFITVVPDDTIQEPGFVIETSFGDIDGRISTQIEELRKRVLE